MGGSAACWGEQGYVASPLRQVNARAPFQQLHNSSHKPLLHSWSGRITVLSRFKDQWSRPAKDPITSVVLERSPWSPYVVGAAWVALAFRESCWIVSNWQPGDPPHLPIYATKSFCLSNMTCTPTFKLLYYPQVLLPILRFTTLRL